MFSIKNFAICKQNVIILFGGVVMKIGDNIKKIRKNKGITQKDLAKMLDDMPVSTLANYENNHRQADVQTLNKIAEALKVSFDDLFGISRIFSQLILDELEIPILRMYGITDTLEILSEELKIKYSDLEKVASGIELSSENQLKLVKFLYEIDYPHFLSFCEKNSRFILDNKDLNTLYLNSLSNEFIKLDNSKYLAFKNYLLVTFGDRINEFTNEDSLRDIEEETSKFLEFALYKLEKEYYEEDDNEE